jgi:uncharacterized protein DUF5677
VNEHEMLIKVRENEFRRLIDREKVVAEIREHLKPWVDLIYDLVNYGSNLIPRAFASSERNLKDTVVIAVLLRQAVAMLDGVEVLLSKGACHAAQLQMRALFEAALYIEWILSADSEEKATYYYVHNLRRKRLWALKTQPGFPDSQQFINLMNKSGVQVTQEITDSCNKQIKEIDRVLSQTEFAKANSAFDKHKKGKREVSWYVPLGESNLRTIAEKVDRLPLYLILYGGASEVMHTSSYDHHIKIGRGEVTFHSIRSPEGFENIFRFTVSIALYTFRRILQEYRPGEVAAFGRKYSENWQKEFLNLPKIVYKVETSRI